MNGDTFCPFIVGLIIGLLIGIIITALIADSGAKNEAVKHGAASWSPNENGEPTFTWKKQ